MDGPQGVRVDAVSRERARGASPDAPVALRALLVVDGASEAQRITTALDAAGLAPRTLRVDTLPALDGALRGRDWDVAIVAWPPRRIGGEVALARLLEGGESCPVIVLGGALDDAEVLRLAAAGVSLVIDDDHDSLGDAVRQVLDLSAGEAWEHDPGLTLAARLLTLVEAGGDLPSALERTLEFVCTSLDQPYAESWLRRPQGAEFESGPGFDREPRLARLREDVDAGAWSTGVVREVVTLRRSRVVPALRGDGGRRFGRARAALDLGLDGVTAVPVTANGQVVAVMLTLGRDGAAPDPLVRGVLEIAAHHLGSHLARTTGDGRREAGQRRLTALLDHLEDGVIASDRDGRITLFNRAMERFHGKGPVAGATPEAWAAAYDLYLVDGVTAMRPDEAPLFRALRGETLEDERFVIAAPGVRRRAVRASAQPLYGPDGGIEGALAVVHDDSERAAASAEAVAAGQRALQTFSLLLDQLADLALRVGEAETLHDAWPAFADFAERTLGADELYVVRGGPAGAPEDTVASVRFAVARRGSALVDDRASDVAVGALAREAIAARRIVVERDVQREGLVAARPMRSAAAVPLTLGPDVLGALEIRAAQPFAFDDAATVALTMAATLAAIAIDHDTLVDGERRSREVAEAAARHFRSAFTANPAAVALVSLELGNLLDVNPAMEALTGFARTELVGRNAATLGLWDLADAGALATLATDEGVRGREMRLRRKSGEWRTCLVSAEPTELVDGGVGERALLLLAVDVTERIEQQRQLGDLARFRESLMAFIGETLDHGFEGPFYQRLLEAAVRATPGAEAGSLLLLDTSDERYRYVAVVGYDLTGLADVAFDENAVRRVSEVGGRATLVHGFDGAGLPEHQLAALREAGRIDEIRSSLVVPIDSDGRRVAVVVLDSLSDRAAFDDGSVGLAEAFAAQVATLIKRRALELELEHMAYHDTLTGLPNRTLFLDRLQQAVTRSQRGGRRGAALFVDLDNLKVTNDALGHAVGDALLQSVGERLRASVRADDTVARIGGDEFTLVLSEVEDAAAAANVAEKLLVALRAPFHLLGHVVHVSASVGITLFPDDATDADTLVRHGDTAMYQAKAQGKDRYRFFTREMNRALLERASLEAQLRVALEHDAFTLAFQPRVALHDGRITSVEALARWHHPERGDIGPATFIPVAEDAGLIGVLGERLLRLACAQGRAWSDAGIPTVVAFNLSAKQLQERDVVEVVEGVLRETGLPAPLLELELTESAVMRNVEENVVKLSALRALGVQVSIDDFGTAYSSLNYLKRLPATALKVDQSFLRDLGDAGEDVDAGRHDAAIVRAVVALAAALDLVAIAEGVETQGQLRFLRSIGCDQGQGFLFARPQPAAQVELLLRRGRIAVT
jgi:diguanylate cyclase (GGDEF)-like protein/PAS domain S-box-containing protein